MKITRKSPAVYTILIIALLLASTVYPLRLYHENVDISSGSVIPTQVSEVVDDVNDAGDYFLAQLPHLQSLDVWIEERISGETWMLQLFGHKEGGGFELLAEEYLPFPEEGSGFVRVPIDVDLETGEEYVFIVHGAGSEFRVGYETVDLSGNPDVPAYRLGFYQDTGIPAIAVMARFHYRVPLMREKSFFALGAIAIAALLLLAIIWLFFKQHPEKNTQTTVLSAARSVLTPVILGVGALACAAVWPMKLFDERPADIITYEIGIMLAAAVCLYALWHKREENSAHTNEPAAQNLAEEFSKAEKISHSVSTEENKSVLKDFAAADSVTANHHPVVRSFSLTALQHILIALLIAVIFARSAEYMNALNDFIHHRCEYTIAGLMSLIILIMGWRPLSTRIETIFWNGIPILTILAGAVVGRQYYFRLMTPVEEPQAEYINEVLRYQIGAWVLFAAACVCVLMTLVRHLMRNNVQDGVQETNGGRGAEMPHISGKPEAGDGSAEKQRAQTTENTMTEVQYVTGQKHLRSDKNRYDVLHILLGVGAAVFFIMLYVNRNGRWWITELIGMYALLFIQFLCWEEKKGWLKDVAAGILINFFWSVGYSMLHRYYFAYYYSRFSMHFHTVTVTAYYLLLPLTASLTLLVKKWNEADASAESGKKKFRMIWKELLMFGTAASYLLMSLSRAGIYIGVLLIIFGVVAAAIANRQSFLRPLGRLVVMLLAFLLTLPMIFTGQRIISTVNHRPERFEALEIYPDAVLRNPTWDSKWFMSVEVFTEMVLDRVIGGPAAALSDKLKEGDDGQWVENDPRLSGYEGAWLDTEENNHNSQYVLAGRNAAKESAERDISIKDPFENQNRTVIDAAEDCQIQTGAAGAVSAPRGKLLYFLHPLTYHSTAGRVASYLLTADPEWELEGLEQGDYSNGRMELFRTYIDQLDMKGHTYMGADMPNGEKAVHAHNIYLQTAFDCGIPTGVMLLVFGLLLWAASFRYYMKRSKAGDGLSLLPLLVVTGFGIMGVAEWIFHFCNPFTIMLMMSAFPVLAGVHRAE